MNQNSVYNIGKSKKQAESIIESSIFELAMKGEPAALGAIYDTYFEEIFRFLYFRTSHQQTAEDLAEEVFIRAFRALPTLKGGKEKLRGWIYQIARNILIDYYRKHRPTTPLEEVETILEDTRNSIVDTLNLESDQRTLLAALQKLPSEYQSVIRMRFLEELEISDIATILNKSEGNIRIIQYRGLQKLRDLLLNNQPF